MRYVFGVDAGASKTYTLLADKAGHILSFGQAGCGNHQNKGLDPALLEIKKSVDSAVHQAGLEKVPSELGCFCLAGADLPEDYAMLEQALASLELASRIIVKNDSMAALRAGLTKPWGVVVICGSGFNAAGRGMDGRELILPGLGAISGDWGGGGALGLEMIRRVMRAWDGRGKPTRLTQLVLKALSAPDEPTLIARLYRDEVPEGSLLNLVPLLFPAAQEGDEVARELVIHMGEEVGITARAIIRRLGLTKEEVEVILGGSVFKGKGTLFLDTINRNIHKEVPQAIIRRPCYEPVFGAVMLALEAAGLPIDEDRAQVLLSTLPERLQIAGVTFTDL